MNVRKGYLGLVAILIGLVGLLTGPASTDLGSTALAQSDPTVTVQLTITRVREISDLEDGGRANFDADVYIDGEEFDVADVEENDNDISPNWQFTKEFPLSRGSVPLEIQIWEADNFLRGDDDHTDIQPGPGYDLELIAVFDPCEVLRSDMIFVDDCGATIQSQGDDDGDAVAIEYNVQVIPTNPGSDQDGDGLPDDWELNGLDIDGDGNIDLDLPAMGADPMHKDIFIEYDWTPGNEPNPEAVQIVKDAFAAAPIDAGGIPNPDGLPGINLWIDTGGLTDDGVLVGDNLGNANNEIPFGVCDLGEEFYEAKTSFFDHVRSFAFHYMISGNQGCFGGHAELGGNDILDAYDAEDFVSPFISAERALALEAGHIMHELGHNLYLHHGGAHDQTLNCKPNYVSVMNYALPVIERTDGTLIVDYSPPRFPGGRGQAPLPKLYEDDLSESIVLDPTDPVNQFVSTGPAGQELVHPLNEEVDWNGDGVADNPDLPPININDHHPGTACPGSDRSDETLEGHNDWANISLPFLKFGDSSDGAVNPITVPEPTLEEILALQKAVHTTDLAIAQTTSRDPAVAGDILSYTLTVTNNGPNPAGTVEVIDTLPAGVSYLGDDAGCNASDGAITCDLGYMPGGASQEITITTRVHPDLVFKAGGQTKITNTVAVSDIEFAQDSDTTNNTTSIEAQVVAKADLEILSFAQEGAIIDALVGQPVEVSLSKVITNHGPSAPMDVAVHVTAAASAGLTVAADPANPTEATAVALAEQREMAERFALTCDAPGEQSATFTNTIAPLDPADSDPDPSDNSNTIEVEVNCVVPVAINIMPGSAENPINFNGQGATPLAILSTGTGEYSLPVAFDATGIDPLSVRFGTADALFDTSNPAGAGETHQRGHVEDVYELDEDTKDGDQDMMLHFRLEGSGLEPGATKACVRGVATTASGDTINFFGCDAISTRP